LCIAISGLDIHKKQNPHGYGEGSFLNEFTFDYFLSILFEIPPIQVELTGAVGVGDKLKETDIEKQRRILRYTVLNLHIRRMT
jgi:hypothetical protein